MRVCAPGGRQVGGSADCRVGTRPERAAMCSDALVGAGWAVTCAYWLPPQRQFSPGSAFWPGLQSMGRPHWAPQPPPRACCLPALPATAATRVRTAAAAAAVGRAGWPAARMLCPGATGRSDRMVRGGADASQRAA